MLAQHAQRDLAHAPEHPLHARHPHPVYHVLSQPAAGGEGRAGRRRRRRGRGALHGARAKRRTCCRGPLWPRHLQQCYRTPGTQRARPARPVSALTPPPPHPTCHTHLKGTISGLARVRPLSKRQEKSTCTTSPLQQSSCSGQTAGEGAGVGEGRAKMLRVRPGAGLHCTRAALAQRAGTRACHGRAPSRPQRRAPGCFRRAGRPAPPRAPPCSTPRRCGCRRAGR